MSKENADYLMQAAMNAGIVDHKELANFMGQMQVESGNFNESEENLHYSPDQLLTNFKGRNGLQSLDQAREIVAGGPEAVANEIYGGDWGRKKLGNTEPGDGYTYRGRGFTQLTGRDQYRIHGDNTGLDVTNKPDAAAERDNAARLAVDKWKTDVVRFGDQQDVRQATRDINGGTNGLAAREAAATGWERKLAAGYRPGQPDHTADPSATDRRQLQAGLNTLGYTPATAPTATADVVVQAGIGLGAGAAGAATGAAVGFGVGMGAGHLAQHSEAIQAAQKAAGDYLTQHDEKPLQQAWQAVARNVDRVRSASGAALDAVETAASGALSTAEAAGRRLLNGSGGSPGPHAAAAGQDTPGQPQAGHDPYAAAQARWRSMAAQPIAAAGQERHALAEPDEAASARAIWRRMAASAPPAALARRTAPRQVVGLHR